MDHVHGAPSRYFTPAEANAELPQVRVLLEKALALSKKLRELVESGDSKEIDALKAQVLSAVDRIRERGVEVKGLDAGLLDFPAMRNGKLVYLCWRVGESSIDWWHPLHTGFRGRRRIEGPESKIQWEWRN